MKFKIKRASDYRGTYSPCDGAVKEADGSWSIELASVEQMVELSKLVHDGLIVSVDEDGPSLTIYDSWVE